MIVHDEEDNRFEDDIGLISISFLSFHKMIVHDEEDNRIEDDIGLISSLVFFLLQNDSA
jgi:hypothetical protein